MLSRRMTSRRSMLCGAGTDAAGKLKQLLWRDVRHRGIRAAHGRSRRIGGKRCLMRSPGAAPTPAIRWRGTAHGAAMTRTAANALLHARPSIIDPRPNADQPMANEAGDSGSATTARSTAGRTMRGRWKRRRPFSHPLRYRIHPARL